MKRLGEFFNIAQRFARALRRLSTHWNKSSLNLYGPLT